MFGCQNENVQTVRRALVLALTAAAIASAQSNPAHTAECDDVTKLDFGNLIVRTAQRTFNFHNGIAVNYDSPPGQGAEHSQSDWKAAIEKETVVQPAPDVVVRFLLIHDSHETGSGGRYYATALRCAGGKLQEVFHRDGLSLRVDRLDSTTINISLHVTPEQPIEKHWSCTWDRDTSRYVLSPTPSSVK
jgi:hypothetical protein